MDGNNLYKWIIAGVVTLLLATVIYAVVTMSPWTKSIQWNETYRMDDKNPMGGYLAYELVKERFRDNHFVTMVDPLEESMPVVEENQLYVYIGEDHYLPDDNDLFRRWLEGGNDLFISSKLEYWALPEIISEVFDCLYMGDYYSDTNRLFANYVDPVFKSDTNCSFIIVDSLVSYFSIDTCSYELFSYSLFNGEELTNAVILEYGQSKIVLHSQPAMFSNHFLATPEGLDYFDKIFSHFDDPHVYWDEISKIPLVEDRSDLPSPLSYVLAQPALRWAWYTLVFGGFLFLLFAFRRKERPIPVLPLPENTSREYIKTLSGLYQQSKKYNQMLDMKVKLFHDDMKLRYPTDFEWMTTEWIDYMSMKTRLPKSEWKKLKDKLDSISNRPIQSMDLLLVSSLIQKIRNKINVNL